MKTSTNGIELIKRFEGFSPIVYKCPAGIDTIGYGHAIKKNETFNKEITKLEADEILRGDLVRFEAAIQKLVKVPLNQNQFDALVSFTYNLGEGALQRSTLRSMINREEHEEAAKEFLKWVKSGGKKLPGLIARRQAESNLYLT